MEYYYSKVAFLELEDGCTFTGCYGGSRADIGCQGDVDYVVYCCFTGCYC